MNNFNKICIRNRLSTIIALLTGSLVLSPIVQAQETTEKTDELKIEKILVTAQKRVQSLQDVPITITTLGEQELLNAGVSSVEDIQTLVPSLNIFSSANPAMTSISIRGAGTGASDPTIQPSVGVFVDGVFMPRSVFGITDLVDINRVEILLGPQGTLYGKNTNSGVISVSTKGAPDEFEVQVEATLGSDNIANFKGSVGVAATDDLSFRFGVVTSSRDGFIENLATGNTLNDVDRQAFRAQMFWDITDDFSLRAIAYTSADKTGSKAGEFHFDYEKAGQGGFLSPTIAAAEAEAGRTLVDTDSKNRQVYVNEQTEDQNLDADGGSIQLDYDMGAYSITSITAFQKWSQTDSFSDLDGTAIDFAHSNNEMGEESFSQELRISSFGGDSFEWMAGVFYFDSELELGLDGDDSVFATFGADYSLPAAYGGTSIFAIGDTVNWYNKHETQSIAVFGQGTWYINDDLNVVVGLRYGKEEKDFRVSSAAYQANGTQFNRASFLNAVLYGMGNTSLPFGNQIYTGGYYGPGAVSGPLIASAADDLGVLLSGGELDMTAGPVNEMGSRSDDDVTGMISVNYNIDAGMLFATVSTGAKSGGFNGAFSAQPIDAREYNQETTTNFEVGAKLDLFDSRMRLNTSIFYTVYDDFQAAAFDPELVAFTVANAGKQTTQGIDVDITYLISEELSVTAKIEYLDAKYNDFDGANCAPSADVTWNLDANGAKESCDLSGHVLPFAADWSGSISFDYSRELVDGELYVNLNNSFKSDHFADPTFGAYSEQDYMLWNARIGWRSDNWDLSVWSKNITDETYAHTHSGNVITPKPYFGTGANTDHRVWLGDPMTAGVTIRYNFY